MVLQSKYELAKSSSSTRPVSILDVVLGYNTILDQMVLVVAMWILLTETVRSLRNAFLHVSMSFGLMSKGMMTWSCCGQR